MPPKKKYERIAYEIGEIIRKGEFPENGQAPTLDELSQKYNISRMTAQNVLKQLVAKGLISTCRGRRSTIIVRNTINQQTPLHDKKIALIGNFEYNSHYSMVMPHKIANFLKNKLIELNNHVMSFPFSSIPQICAKNSNDIDAYIMIDVLSVNDEYEECLKQTGRPYVILQCTSIAETKPNRIALFFKSAFLRIIFQFLRMGIENFLFLNVDARSITFETESDALMRHISRNTSEVFSRSIVHTLRNHGIPEERITFHDPGFSYEVSTELAEYLLANNLPRKSAFMTISENSALGIYDFLTKKGWIPGQDFCILILDPATKALKKLHHIYIIEINLKEVYGSILKSLSYQFSHKTNFAPGDIIDLTFIKRL